MSVAWDQKYRPLRFDEVIGQEGAVEVLKARLAKGTAMDTSYLFPGGHGQGKTTLARILARAILCTDLGSDYEPCNKCDNCQAILTETSLAFRELDAASSGTIEHVRGIVEELPFAVEGAAKRIVLFDECHRMSRDSQDVLLKPLEDKKLLGLFCTTEGHKVRDAIVSRCETHTIRPVPRDQILTRMKTILEKESVEYDETAVLTVIDFHGGHVRDVISKLGMIAQLGPVTVEAVRDYLDLGLITTYFDILLNLGDSRRALELMETACDRVGPDDVASGIAEAAMSAFKLQFGIGATLVLADRDKAKQVYDLYGDALTDLAGFFVNSRRSGKVGLTCDIVACAKGVPQFQAAQAGPPVVVAAPVAQAAPAPAPTPDPTPAPTPAEPPTEPQEPSQEEPPTPESPAPPPPPEPPPTPAEPPASAPRVLDPREDTSLNLTKHDQKAIPQTFPRGHEHEAKPAAVPKNSEGQVLLPAEEWRRSFAAFAERMRGRPGEQR